MRQNSAENRSIHILQLFSKVWVGCGARSALEVVVSDALRDHGASFLATLRCRSCASPTQFWSAITPQRAERWTEEEAPSHRRMTPEMGCLVAQVSSCAAASLLQTTYRAFSVRKIGFHLAPDPPHRRSPAAPSRRRKPRDEESRPYQIELSCRVKSDLKSGLHTTEAARSVGRRMDVSLSRRRCKGGAVLQVLTRKPASQVSSNIRRRPSPRHASASASST